MDFTVRPMTHSAAHAIAEWHYDPPFDFYDLDADPEDYAAFFDADRWGDELFAVYAADTTDDVDAGDLVGFYEFERLDDDTVEIGLGLHPDLTGQGYGEAFVERSLTVARTEFDATEFRLAVAAFNDRARTVYERLGFDEVDHYEQYTNGRQFEFVELRKTA